MGPRNGIQPESLAFTATLTAPMSARPLHPGPEQAHHATHVPHRCGAGIADGGFDHRVDLGRVERPRHVPIDDGHFFPFGRRQIVAARAFVLPHRLPALLEHLLEHGHDAGVVEGRGAPVDLLLLDCCGDHAQGPEPRLVPGAHRILDVFDDAGFQGIGHGAGRRRGEAQ